MNSVILRRSQRLDRNPAGRWPGEFATWMPCEHGLKTESKQAGNTSKSMQEKPNLVNVDIDRQDKTGKRKESLTTYIQYK